MIQYSKSIVTASMPILVSTHFACAQSLTPQQITALNNLQEEFTTCSAYYATQISCTSPARKQEAKEKIDPILKTFNSMAVLIGSKIGMTKDAMEQRLKRVFEEQGRITNNNVCINIDFFTHDAPCDVSN